MGTQELVSWSDSAGETITFHSANGGPSKGIIIQFVAVLEYLSELTTKQPET